MSGDKRRTLIKYYKFNKYCVIKNKRNPHPLLVEVKTNRRTRVTYFQMFYFFVSRVWIMLMCVLYF
jgi:heme/copper-type cytochrome/quinol oxidase subunit 3